MTESMLGWYLFFGYSSIDLTMRTVGWHTQRRLKRLRAELDAKQLEGKREPVIGMRVRHSVGDMSVELTIDRIVGNRVFFDDDTHCERADCMDWLEAMDDDK